jgi:hypothetical protein
MQVVEAVLRIVIIVLHKVQVEVVEAVRVPQVVVQELMVQQELQTQAAEAAVEETILVVVLKEGQELLFLDIQIQELLLLVQV